MNAYNEIDGVLCAADRELLTAILRDEWGFDGYVVSDYFSIRQLADVPPARRGRRETPRRWRSSAGLDVELPATDCYGAAAARGARRRASSSEQTLDEAVRRVLRAKFDLGLFDEPYVDVEPGVAGAAGTPAHRELARTIARKSIVLLKNDGVLPLASDLGVDRGDRPERRHGPQPVRRLLLPGPRRVAARGARRAAGAPSRSPVRVAGGGRAGRGSTRPRSSTRCAQRFGASVAFARGCDVNRSSRERLRRGASSWPAAVRRRGHGDGRQGRAHRRLHERRVPRPRLARPSGRPGGARARGDRDGHARRARARRRDGPSASAWLHEHCAAVVAGLAPGRGGRRRDRRRPQRRRQPRRQAPDLVPARRSARCPVFYAHKVSGGRSQPDGRLRRPVGEPAVPVRSRAQLHDVRAVRVRASGSRRCGWNGEIVVDVVGHQHGRPARATRSCSSTSATRRRASPGPCSSSRASCAWSSTPGESKAITFHVPVAQLGFYDRGLSYVVEPGAIEVFVGRSSADVVEAGSVTVVEDPSGTASAEGLRRIGLGRLRRTRVDGSRCTSRQSGSAAGGRRASGSTRHEGLRRRRQGGRRRQPRDRRRRVHGARRPLRLREVDAPADDRGSGAGCRAARSSSAARTSPTRSPRDRDIAMVFQNYALYPHMTVDENLGSG